MLISGVPLIQCLNILIQQTENFKLRKAIENIYGAVQKGATLTDAMRQQRLVFPELLINMVEAAESSGNLDTIMEKMASHYEKEAKLKNKIISAMLYPIILVIVSTAVVIFMLTTIFPIFINMFENSGVSLPTPTLILLKISNCINHHWYIFILILNTFIYIANKYFKTENGKRKLDALKLKIPIIKNTIIKISASRFTRTLSILLSSGIPFLTAIDIISNIVGNQVISDGLLTVKEDLRKGHDLAESLHRSSIFPPMVNAMVRIGEESGSLEEILKKTADYYDYEIESEIQKMTTLLEPIMIIIMAIIVGFIIIAMYLPIVDMIQII